MARLRSKRDTGAPERRKRTTGRSKPAALATKPAVPKSFTLEGFFTLPYELKMVVIKLTCSATSSPASDAASGNPTRSWRHDRPSASYMRPRLDFKTTLGLLSSSKAFYALVAPHLYSSVLISRPSALASLSLALASQPGLGGLIKNLYVGPVDPLPDWYWPIAVEDRSDLSTPLPQLVLIRNSLRADREAKHLLRWSAPEERWLRHFGGYEPTSEAVCDAVAAAERIIDVDFDRYKRSHAGKTLTKVEYTQRVFEVQAALDQYLIATRLEGERPPSNTTEESDDEDDSTYPTLVLTGYSESPSPDPQSQYGEGTCVLDRSQLLRHLARPHALTDRFDHPLVFARSGLETIALRWYDVEPTRRQPHQGSGAEDWARLFSPSLASPDFSLRAPPSLHSLLDLLRSVLVRTHHLKSLALAGFLNLAVFGDQPTTLGLGSIQSLSIGPLPQDWFQPMELHRFSGLTNLRLCGVRLHEDELADVIAMFPILRRLQYSMASRWRSEHSPSLCNSIARLAGSEDTLHDKKDDMSSGIQASSTLDLSRPPKPSGSASSASCAASAEASSSLPLVEVRMHHSDLRRLLEAQLDTEVRNAWSFGLPLPNQKRRLLLAESLPESMEGQWRPLVSEDLFEEGIEWWAEHGVGR